MSSPERHLRVVDENFIQELSGLQNATSPAVEPQLRIDSRIPRVKPNPIPRSTYIRRRIGVGISAVAVVGTAILGIHALTSKGDELSCVPIGNGKRGQEETTQRFQARVMMANGIDPSARSFEQAVDDAVCALDNPQSNLSPDGVQTIYISKR